MEYTSKVLEWIQDHSDELDNLLDMTDGSEGWEKLFSELRTYSSGLVVIFLMDTLDIGWEEMLTILGPAIHDVTFIGMELPDKLVDVIWPQGAASNIPEYLFSKSNIRSITIKKNDLKRIKDEAFSYCDNLTKVYIESCERFEEYVFYACRSLSEIKLPEGCSNLGSGVLFGCDGLKLLEIPQSIKHIGKNATGIFNGSEKIVAGKVKIKVTGLNKDEAVTWLNSVDVFDKKTRTHISSRFI